MEITGAIICLKNGNTFRMEDDGEIDMNEIILRLNAKLKSNSFIRYNNTLINTNEIAYISYLEANKTEQIQDKIETIKSLEECDPIPAYWINRRINGGGIKKVCSKCGYEVDQYISHSYNFCANCGKKMRNPEETV